MNDTNILSEEKLSEVQKLQTSQTYTNKETTSTILPAEKKLPAPQKEVPVNKWIMPPEQHGYIQASDNDCL